MLAEFIMLNHTGGSISTGGISGHIGNSLLTWVSGVGAIFITLGSFLESSSFSFFLVQLWRETHRFLTAWAERPGRHDAMFDHLWPNIFSKRINSWSSNSCHLLLCNLGSRWFIHLFEQCLRFRTDLPLWKVSFNFCAMLFQRRLSLSKARANNMESSCLDQLYLIDKRCYFPIGYPTNGMKFSLNGSNGKHAGQRFSCLGCSYSLSSGF